MSERAGAETGTEATESDLGACDTCGGELGARGFMKPSGETLRLSEDGPELPVYRFFCSQTCVDNDPGGY
jgi:hypothetical protein